MAWCETDIAGISETMKIQHALMNTYISDTQQRNMKEYLSQRYHITTRLMYISSPTWPESTMDAIRIDISLHSDLIGLFFDIPFVDAYLAGLQYSILDGVFADVGGRRGDSVGF
jgi:hypothetical protein